MNESLVSAAENDFFTALVSAETGSLEQLLTNDFTLVGINGALITKPELTGAIAAGILVFERIEPLSAAIRLYGSTAVVTGQTRMNGSFAGTPFTADSRYTHVYIEQDSRWRLAAAQGTPIL